MINDVLLRRGLLRLRETTAGELGGFIGVDKASAAIFLENHPDLVEPIPGEVEKCGKISSRKWRLHQEGEKKIINDLEGNSWGQEGWFSSEKQNAEEAVRASVESIQKAIEVLQSGSENEIDRIQLNRMEQKLEITRVAIGDLQKAGYPLAHEQITLNLAARKLAELKNPNIAAWPPRLVDIPDSIRSIMKSSIEEARKAFDTFIASSEKMIQSGVNTSAMPDTGSLKLLNEKIAAFTRECADSNFNLAVRLTEARQVTEIVELQSDHLRNQMETFGRQLEELGDLTLKIAKEDVPHRASRSRRQTTPRFRFISRRSKLPEHS
jgi:hypothetical protein